MFVLQTLGIVASGFFAVAFVRGCVQALTDDHRRRKKLLKKLEESDPYLFPTKPPQLKVFWPDSPQPRRKPAAKKKTGAKRRSTSRTSKK